MPVVESGSPTVSVSLPVPTPVQQKPRRPVTFRAPPPQPAPQADATGVPPVAPPQPQMTALVLPWGPPPKPTQMSRRDGVRRYAEATNHEALAVGLANLAKPEHEVTRRGGEGADHTFRGRLADLLQDHEREEEANLLRSGRPVFVHEGQVRAVPRSVEVRGRRWFQRSAGNTYHTAHVFIDGKHVLEIPRSYGYDSQYLDNAFNALEKNGLIPPRQQYGNGGAEAPWQWASRHGTNLDYTHEDVPRQRDLTVPPPPSQYQSDTPTQLRRLPQRRFKYSKS